MFVDAEAVEVFEEFVDRYGVARISVEKYLGIDLLLPGGDMVEELLVPIIKDGRQVYDFPTINEISRHREEQLKKFRDIENYPVIVSEGIRKAQEEVMRKYKT